MSASLPCQKTDVSFYGGLNENLAHIFESLVPSWGSIRNDYEVWPCWMRHGLSLGMAKHTSRCLVIVDTMLSS